MQITIYPSELMGARQEGNLVRICKTARSLLHVRANQSKLVGELESNHSRLPDEKKLAVHKPYIADVEKLVAPGKLYGFVSPRVFAMMIDYRSFMERERVVLAGTDPEFCFSDRDDHRCKYAAHVLDDDDGVLRFGADGPCGEVRPSPSDSGLGLLSSLRKCFELGAETMDAYYWLGGSVQQSEGHRVYTLGGQFHIGEPSDHLLDLKTKLALRPTIIRILDELIGIPMARFEGPEGLTRRTTHTGYNGNGIGGYYGRWGDFRNSKNRFEWRSLSGSWLLSHSLTESLGEVILAITDAIYKAAIARFGPEQQRMEDIEAFDKLLREKLLVLNYTDPAQFDHLLRVVGANPTELPQDMKLVLAALKVLPEKLGVVDEEGHFHLLNEVVQRTITDFGMVSDLKKIWLDDLKDPITWEPLSKRLEGHKEKQSGTDFKLVDFTKESDKNVNYFNPVPIQAQPEELYND